MTPEGRVKKIISSYLDGLKEHLDSRGKSLYYSMFVPTGYGKRNSLDYTICFAGRHVAIEAKAPDEDLTPNQRFTARDIVRSGGTVFIISGAEGLEAFKRWVVRHEHWYAES